MLQTAKILTGLRRLSTAAAILPTLALLAMAARWPHPIHAAAGTPTLNQGWSAYNGGVDGDHASALAQVNRANVHLLRPAWTYDTGEKGSIQTNPLIIGHVLYGLTPTLKAFALDAATGRRLWQFDSGVQSGQPSRGLSWWTGGPDGKDRRLFVSIMNNLYALDPDTGKPVAGFGDKGHIDLRKNLGDDEHYQQLMVVMTSPGVVYKDTIITGFRTSESAPAPHGDIRAFDVHTGALRWSFHTIPHPGEFGYETWPPGAWKTAGSANNWAGMTLDAQRGIVYAPTGSPVSDFYGADRAGNTLFGDTLLALDANTGKRLWHFQGVHHDIWDRDFPSPPALLTIHKDGGTIDALAQTTKQGYLYLFDRVTGAPLYPIEERHYAASTVPGEQASSTQPFPLGPAPIARQMLTADMITQRTPAAHDEALQRFLEFRSAGQFVPLAVDRQTVVFPGFDGGAEWGGPAIDRKTGVMYVNANDLPWTGGLVENKQAASPGEAIYQSSCASCHGEERKGSPPAFPSLVNINARLTDAQITSTIQNGKGRMPSFPNLSSARLDLLLAFLKSGGTTTSARTVLSPAPGDDSRGADVYQQNCAVCHGDDRAGIGDAFPSLIGIGARRDEQQVTDIVHNGKGRMPAFKRRLSADDTAHLLRFLSIGASSAASDKKELQGPDDEDATQAKYRFTGYRKFQDIDGYPAAVPPWGTLNAIDLNTGRYLWKVPLGEYPELAASGAKITGTENYGGPVVTASGLIFIGATVFDDKIRAFDSSTGKLLWEYKLPFAGVATPAIYMVNGKEYVVIAASGGRNPKEAAGGQYVAFALP